MKTKIREILGPIEDIIPMEQKETEKFGEKIYNKKKRQTNKTTVNKKKTTPVKTHYTGANIIPITNRP